MTQLRPAEKTNGKFQNPIPTTIGGFSLVRKLLPLYFANKEERFPKQSLGPFRTNASIYAEKPKSGLRITWFGHSSLLLEFDAVRVLIDPVWDKRASPVGWAGPKRFFAPTLLLSDLPRIDAILISHDHYDHLGKQTIRQLCRLPGTQGVQWITSLGVGKLLGRFGVPTARIAELNWTEAISVTNDLRITALPARHFSGRSLGNRFHTLWSSFALRSARHNLYYGADSGLWDGFSEIGQNFGPFDLTMLEVGAYHELWKAIHMGPDGAAAAFASLGRAGLLMPIHWGLFDLALHAWNQPIERITEIADGTGIRLWSPAPGVPTEVSANTELRSEWWTSSHTGVKEIAAR